MQKRKENIQGGFPCVIVVYSNEKRVLWYNNIWWKSAPHKPVVLNTIPEVCTEHRQKFLHDLIPIVL